MRLDDIFLNFDNVCHPFGKVTPYRVYVYMYDEYYSDGYMLLAMLNVSTILIFTLCIINEIIPFAGNVWYLSWYIRVVLLTQNIIIQRTIPQDMYFTQEW